MDSAVLDSTRHFRYWTLVVLSGFSIAMALLESAVVVYMRRLYYPENPMDLFPLHFLNHYDPVLELSRELATVVMIVTVALSAERGTNFTRKFAAFVFVFGTWDLFYYVWLKALIDWPRTWTEWDVLFLIPMIWVGPWICPTLIAVLFIVWGGWVLYSPKQLRLTYPAVCVFVSGAAMGLVSFMQPIAAVTWAVGPAETHRVAEYTPGEFWWWLYALSFVIMTVGFAMTKNTPSTE